jgi:hypothetical protein
MGVHDAESIERRLDELSKLEHGWLDGYGEVIHPDNIENAKLFIEFAGISEFAIFPTESGGVQLEWVSSNKYMEICFDVNDTAENMPGTWFGNTI